MKQNSYRYLVLSLLLLFLSGCLKSHNPLNDTVMINNNKITAVEIKFVLSERTYGYTINPGLFWESTGLEEIENANSVELLTNEQTMYSGSGTTMLELFEQTRIDDDATSYHYAYELTLED